MQDLTQRGVGGGAGISPTPEILKLSMVFPGRACPQAPLVGKHAYVYLSVLSCATIIVLPSCPHPQLKILYETL